MLVRLKTLHKTQHMGLLSIAAAILTLCLKFGAYFLTQSISLYSDALETFVNLLAGFIVLFVVSIAAKPPDKKHSYGHDKAEYFSSGVEGGLILLAALSIIYMAIERILYKHPLEHLLVGISVSLIASTINYGTAFYIAKAAKQHDSITLEANAKHLMTDVWTSLGVASGLLVVHFLPPAWQILDPLIAICVAILILITSFDLLKRSIDGFMDAALPLAEIKAIESLIQTQLRPPQRFTELKTRKAGAKRFIEFSLLLEPSMSVAASHHLCDQIEAGIKNRFADSLVHIHIHVEPL